MRILGINAFGQNPSACLVIDGKLAGFSHEERFTRIKGSHGLFPSHAITWLLGQNRLNLSDIHRIAFSWGCRKYPWRELYHLAKAKFRTKLQKRYRSRILKISKKGNSNISDAFEHLLLYTPGSVKSKIRSRLREFGHHGPIPPVEFIDHHDCHAYQAYYHSPFSEAVILVADGHGEENCISGYVVRNGNFNKIFGYDIPVSLGWFYAGMTAYLGFQPNRDEGKTMGLAAYGEKRKDRNVWLDYFDGILEVTSGGIDINPYFFKFGPCSYHPGYTDYLVDYILSKNRNLTPVGANDMVSMNGKIMARYLLDEYVDLAYATQAKLESALISLVNRLVRSTGIKNLCLVGGVAMNCKANGAVFDDSIIDNIFIHPAASDDGSAIGAAFYLAKALDRIEKQTLNHAQCGAFFPNDKVELLLKSCGLTYKKPADICADTARLLSEGKVVGWFQGPAEMGARALGGRSIIANPVLKDVKYIINSRIKYREEWRPYCPSILSEHKDNFFNVSVETPFMTLAVDVNDRMAESMPSVIHVDNTCRPQTVTDRYIPKYHHLIKEFKSLTGLPIILNTSFNTKNEPIVNSPLDAIRTYFSTGLDALAIEDFLVEKQLG